jgi:very-short-patch-repair endonuclease
VAENVHRFAARQGGHVTREQLLAAGMSRRTIDRWIASKRLFIVYRSVYAVGHLQRNPVDAAHAAVLAGGDHCALAGGCGLVLWGVWRYWPKRFEIVLAGNRRPSGLIVHHSATLLRRDITTVQGLRVTSPARTMLDTAGRLSAKQLAHAINDLRLRDLLTIDQLSDVVARNPKHGAVTLLRPHLEFAQDEPTRSPLEDIFLALLRKHGLPTPRINARDFGFRVDAHFPDHGLIVELDGWKQHRSKERFLGDRRQDLAMFAATGIPTVRLPSEDVGDAIIGQLSAALDRAQERMAAVSVRGAEPLV